MSSDYPHTRDSLDARRPSNRAAVRPRPCDLCLRRLPPAHPHPIQGEYHERSFRAFAPHGMLASSRRCASGPASALPSTILRAMSAAPDDSMRHECCLRLLLMEQVGAYPIVRIVTDLTF